MTFEKHKHYLWSRSGWLLNEEAELLYYLATRATGTMVEIGSFKGKSACCFLRGTMDGSGQKVISIDKMQRYNEYDMEYTSILAEFKKNIKECDRLGLSTLIMEDSNTAHVRIKDDSIYLLFIDGGHEGVQPKNDYENYLPKVVKDGIVLFHDSTNPSEFVDVYNLIAAVKKDDRVEFLGQIRSISIFKKR